MGISDVIAFRLIFHLQEIIAFIEPIRFKNFVGKVEHRILTRLNMSYDFDMQAAVADDGSCSTITKFLSTIKNYGRWLIA